MYIIENNKSYIINLKKHLIIFHQSTHPYTWPAEMLGQVA